MDWIIPGCNHSSKEPIFLCVLSNTETAYIPNLSGAGESPEMTDYTPAGDAELVEKGSVTSFDIIPMTPPFGTPTPAVITRVALELASIPHIFINSGLKILPDVELVDMKAKAGQDIRKNVAVHDPEKIFDRAFEFGQKISSKSDLFVIGESIPGGTTTAKGVLCALGYDGNVSSSCEHNPLGLKNRIVKEGMQASGVSFGSLRDEPMKAIKYLGDPMMPAVAGIAAGIQNCQVILTGGTQMAAVAAVLKHKGLLKDNISIATTKFIVNDCSASFKKLIDDIGIEMYYADPGFTSSRLPGLRRYEAGDVKEGVGAGGAMYLAAMMGISQSQLLEGIEDLCHKLGKFNG
ncbi:Nicotinate-nucleotide-dimethylbenzimidazole phosphoribosyltransferase [Methanosalsum zhilinae DSM 4017]|uniref:UPF0284 protein Mzhil_0791 n=1 Tax=Methanosalsum zhilinae (strain DSM 4017 / NBRC 107636 / OCM 62 / WeN5) TaxID=679901 RepID=F7XKP4_METZD|nr:TIGR00303 family protein [Methanosalsum zhilinae]AEH60654.1 Nicotinate-nucleotide-dimethylbenzimidazole phosphoribosyltransferase [Methanosalsum zhilinae DSM 4017]